MNRTPELFLAAAILIVAVAAADYITAEASTIRDDMDWRNYNRTNDLIDQMEEADHEPA